MNSYIGRNWCSAFPSFKKKYEELNDTETNLQKKFGTRPTTDK